MVMGNLQHCQYFKTREMFPKGANVYLDPGDTFMKYEELNCWENTNYKLSKEASFVCDNAVRHTRWWDVRFKISKFCGIRKHDQWNLELKKLLCLTSKFVLTYPFIKQLHEGQWWHQTTNIWTDRSILRTPFMKLWNSACSNGDKVH
jgi:hypothetical protein